MGLQETEAYKKILQILSFTNENGEDSMSQQIRDNYNQIKLDMLNIVESEIERIKNDPDLQHLVQQGQCKYRGLYNRSPFINPCSPITRNFFCNMQNGYNSDEWQQPQNQLPATNKRAIGLLYHIH